MEVLKDNIRSMKEEVTVEDIYCLRDELLQMSGPDYSSAGYILAHIEALEKDFEREENYLESKEHALHGNEVNVWNFAEQFIRKTVQ